MADRHWLPLGGLIITSGVTAHLNPFEARALHERMQQAIEETVLAWVREHDLYALRNVPEEIDRKVADPAAKAMIEASALGQNEAEAIPETSSSDPGDCCSDEPFGALCEACRKGPDHV